MEKHLFGLQDVMKEITRSKGLDVAITRSLYDKLVQIHRHASAQSDEALKSGANTFTGMMEEVLTNRFIYLTKSVMCVVLDIYGVIAKRLPGFIRRSVLSNMVMLLTAKPPAAILPGSRECVVGVIALLMEHGAKDMGSAHNEVISVLLTIIKAGPNAADTSFLRVPVLGAMVKIVAASGKKYADSFADICKVLSRYVADKSVDVRIQISLVFYEVVKHGSGLSSGAAGAGGGGGGSGSGSNPSALTYEYLTSFVTGKASAGLEDDHATVQGNYCKAMALLWVVRMEEYAKEQEEAKLVASRGGSDANSGAAGGAGGASAGGVSGKMGSIIGSMGSSGGGGGAGGNNAAVNRRGSLSRLGSSLSSMLGRKVVVEEWDFKAIASLLLKASNPACGAPLGKNATANASAAAMRVANLTVLGYFLDYCISTVAAEAASGAGAGGAAEMGDEEDASKGDSSAANQFEWFMQSVIELANTGTASLNSANYVLDAASAGASGAMSPATMARKQSNNSMATGGTVGTAGSVTPPPPPLSASGSSASSGGGSGSSAASSSTTNCSAEEASLLRTRVATLIRRHVSSNLTEAQRLLLIRWIIQYAVSMDNRTDIELQIVLTELCHLVDSLQEAVGALTNEIYIACLMLLRSSSLSVRFNAANVLVSLCLAMPNLAPQYISDALEYTTTEVKMFTTAAGQSSNNGSGSGSGSGTPIPPGGGLDGDFSDMNEGALVRAAGGGRKSSSSNVAQKMYLFHGYCLLMALIVKKYHHFDGSYLLPQGESRHSMGENNDNCSTIPPDLLHKVLDFGTELLLHDMRAIPTISGRRIMCAVIRSGSLIVSACASLGYDSCCGEGAANGAAGGGRLSQVVQNCATLLMMVAKSSHATNAASAAAASGRENEFGVGGGMNSGNDAIMANPTAASAAAAAAALAVSNNNANNQEIVYEMTVVEAAVTSFAAIEFSCPEALIYEDTCLDNIVNGLDIASKLLSERYAAVMSRNNARYRHIEAILLESYAWLPPGSYPAASPTVFSEAWRVFRDGVASVHETSLLSRYLPPELAVYPVLCPWHVAPAVVPTPSCLAGSAGVGGGNAASGGSSGGQNAHNAIPGANYTSLSLMLNVMDIPPQDDDALMLKLEQFACPLQRREVECVSLFSRYGACVSNATVTLTTTTATTTASAADDGSPTLFESTHSTAATCTGSVRSLMKGAADWKDPTTIPAPNLETRLLDASIAVLSATFGFQTMEAQEALVSFCGRECISLFAKSASTMSEMTAMMFISEEEKKRRERRVFITLRSATCLLCAIVDRFPFSSCVSSDENELAWVKPVLDTLLERTMHCNTTIQAAASVGLGVIATKISDGSALDEIVTKISVAVTTSLIECNKRSAAGSIVSVNAASGGASGAGSGGGSGSSSGGSGAGAFALPEYTSMAEFGGFVLVLGCVWKDFPHHSAAASTSSSSASIGVGSAAAAEAVLAAANNGSAVSKSTVAAASSTSRVSTAISAIIFDCLKRVDTSMTFRANALWALKQVISTAASHAHSTSSGSGSRGARRGPRRGDAAAAMTNLAFLLDKAVNIVETHLVCSMLTGGGGSGSAGGGGASGGGSGGGSGLSLSGGGPGNANAALLDPLNWRHAEFTLLLYSIQQLINMIFPLIPLASTALAGLASAVAAPKSSGKAASVPAPAAAAAATAADPAQLVLQLQQRLFNAWRVITLASSKSGTGGVGASTGSDCDNGNDHQHVVLLQTNLDFVKVFFEHCGASSPAEASSTFDMAAIARALRLTMLCNRQRSKLGVMQAAVCGVHAMANYGREGSSCGDFGGVRLIYEHGLDGVLFATYEWLLSQSFDFCAHRTSIADVDRRSAGGGKAVVTLSTAGQVGMVDTVATRRIRRLACSNSMAAWLPNLAFRDSVLFVVDQQQQQQQQQEQEHTLQGLCGRSGNTEVAGCLAAASRFDSMYARVTNEVRSVILSLVAADTSAPPAAACATSPPLLLTSPTTAMDTEQTRQFHVYKCSMWALIGRAIALGLRRKEGSSSSTAGIDGAGNDDEEDEGGGGGGGEAVNAAGRSIPSLLGYSSAASLCRTFVRQRADKLNRVVLDTSATADPSSSPLLTIPGLQAFFKDFAVEFADSRVFLPSKAAGAMASSYHMKLLGMLCAQLAIRSYVALEQGSPCDKDVVLVQAQTKQKVQQLVQRTAATAPGKGAKKGQAGVTVGQLLTEVPCYLSLQLADVFTMACANATYTIEDCSVVSLQSTSMECIGMLLRQYQGVVDPDAAAAVYGESGSSTSTSVADSSLSIIHQFLVQLMSVLRPCLSVPQNPALTHATSGVCIGLLGSGFISDAVNAKRFSKLVFSHALESCVGTSSKGAGKTDSTVPPLLADDYSLTAVYRRMVCLRAAAELFLITQSGGVGGLPSVGKDVVQAIRSQITTSADGDSKGWAAGHQQAMGVLHNAWKQLCVEYNLCVLRESRAREQEQQEQEQEQEQVGAGAAYQGVVAALRGMTAADAATAGAGAGAGASADNKPLSRSPSEAQISPSKQPQQREFVVVLDDNRQGAVCGSHLAEAAFLSSSASHLITAASLSVTHAAEEADSSAGLLFGLISLRLEAAAAVSTVGRGDASCELPVPLLHSLVHLAGGAGAAVPVAQWATLIRSVLTPLVRQQCREYNGSSATAVTAESLRCAISSTLSLVHTLMKKEGGSESTALRVSGAELAYTVLSAMFPALLQEHTPEGGEPGGVQYRIVPQRSTSANASGAVSASITAELCNDFTSMGTDATTRNNRGALFHALAMVCDAAEGSSLCTSLQLLRDVAAVDAVMSMHVRYLHAAILPFIVVEHHCHASVNCSGDASAASNLAYVQHYAKDIMAYLSDPGSGSDGDCLLAQTVLWCRIIATDAQAELQRVREATKMAPPAPSVPPAAPATTNVTASAPAAVVESGGDFGDFDSFGDVPAADEPTAAAASEEDDFGDFGSFEDAPAVDSAAAAAVQASAEEDDFGDFGSFEDAPAAAATSSGPDAAAAADDFGDFGGFDEVGATTDGAAPAASVDEDFGDFGTFEDPPAAAAAAPASSAAAVAAAAADDFGDFGSFEGTADSAAALSVDHTSHELLAVQRMCEVLTEATGVLVKLMLSVWAATNAKRNTENAADGSDCDCDWTRLLATLLEHVGVAAVNTVQMAVLTFIAQQVKQLPATDGSTTATAHQAAIRSVMSQAFALILTRFDSGASGGHFGNPDTDLLAVQLVFQLYGQLDAAGGAVEELQEKFIVQIIPPLCKLLQHHVSSGDGKSSTVLFCGSAFTRLAQAHANAFKTAIAQHLPDPHKAMLQQSMMLAMQQQQQQQVTAASSTPASGSGSTGGGLGFKKLDMSKYKK